VIIRIEVAAGAGYPFEVSAHPLLEVFDLRQRWRRDREEGHIAGCEMHVGTIVIVSPEGAAFTALAPAVGKHETLHDELRAAREKLGQRLFAARALARLSAILAAWAIRS
jgi:hypothetical protein